MGKQRLGRGQVEGLALRAIQDMSNNKCGRKQAFFCRLFEQANRIKRPINGPATSSCKNSGSLLN
jgi:hypothetical protein